MEKPYGTVTEPQRELPVSEECDVLVCGGGIAGVAAALAAARTGARTLLLEREYMPGGLATLGLVTIYLPLCDGEGHQVSTGIAEELLRLSVVHGMEQSALPTAWLTPQGDPAERRAGRYQVQYNPHAFAIAAEQLLLQAGVRLLYGTVAVQTLLQDDRITGVIVENKSGRSVIRAGAVVDATGDADLCHLAGAGCETFRQGNVLAAWYYDTQPDRGMQLHMLGFCDVPDEYKSAEQKAAGQPRFGGLDAAEITAMMVQAHAQELQDVLKHRQGGVPAEPATLPTIPQLRMTRRLAGVCTPDDKPTHRYEATSIGMIGNWRKRGPVYELPFGCLYSGRVRNLYAAGRCISVTDSMWDITRVIPACAVTGQAAGTAAALGRGERPAIEVLQAQLHRDGVLLHCEEAL